MRTQKATAADIIELEADLTPEDRLEIKAANPSAQVVWDMLEYLKRSEQRPEELTMRSLRSSTGELLLVGGWSSTGLVWMLATNAAKRFRMETYRGTIECRDMALAQCPRLYNMAMRTNKMHVKLLESIGAEFHGPIHGVNGEPFQAFLIE